MDLDNSKPLDVPGYSECALNITGVCSTKKTVTEIRSKLNIKDVSDDIVMHKAKEKTNCDSELCVLKTVNICAENKNASVMRIKPKGPAHNTNLLTNTNIDDVLARLSQLQCSDLHVRCKTKNSHVGYNKEFYHMHFQMIDFAGEKDSSGNWAIRQRMTIAPTELGTISMVKDVILKGFKTFGVVLNTDVRTGGGIHWFSLFCDFRKNPCTIEYFNSSGNKPRTQIQDWLIKTAEEINSSTICKAKIVILSGLVHQRDTESECGLYSLYYIWNRLNGVPAMSFQDKRIPDAKMTKFRDSCFRSEL